MYVAYWLIFVPKGSLRWKDALFWLPYPLLYFCYSLIRGAAVGWYPYPTRASWDIHGCWPTRRCWFAHFWRLLYWWLPSVDGWGAIHHLATGGCHEFVAMLCQVFGGDV